MDTDQPVNVPKIEVIANETDKPSDAAAAAASAAVEEIEHKSLDLQNQNADETEATSSIATVEPVSGTATTSPTKPATPTKLIKTDAESEKSKSDADKEKSEEKENDKKEKGREKQKDKEKDKAKESAESSIVTPDYIQQSMSQIYFIRHSIRMHVRSLMSNHFYPFPMFKCFSNSKCSTPRQFESRDRRETVEFATMPWEANEGCATANIRGTGK